MEKRPERALRSNSDSKDDMIYGTRAVMEAVRAGKEFDRLFVQKNIDNELSGELLNLLRENEIQYSKVPIEKLNSPNAVPLFSSFTRSATNAF